MRPRKAKELISEVAEKHSLPVKTIEDVVNFYWREVWNSLTTAEGIKVHVTNLGDFNIKHWLLNKEISKLDSYIQDFEGISKLKGVQRVIVKAKAEDKLVKLKNLQYMHMDENQRKEFIYEHKKASVIVNHQIHEEPQEKFNSALEK